MNLSDVLIHVNESLNEPQQTALEDALRHIDGVIAPRFNPGTAHLLLVAFNPDVTNSTALLTHVKTLGYTAQLVGV
jgi:hypothetical protein